MIDDVVVREDGTVGGEDDAGAGAARDRRVLVLAEEARDLIAALVVGRHVDLHDTRAHALGHRHERVRELARLGDGTGGGGRRRLVAGRGLRERGRRGERERG